MKCPYCGATIPDDAAYCDVCKQPLTTVPDGSEAAEAQGGRTRLQKTLIAIGWILGVIALGIGIYKLVFWYDSYQITRLYTRGAYTPSVNEMTMSDGRKGHALVFYGKDGDTVFLPELDKCLSICGGVARLEIADSDWFGDAADEYDYADITFAPVVYHEFGGQTPLPLINYRIDVPNSPLTVMAPKDGTPSVVTSSYTLELQTVPGSSMYINGEDVTERLDRSGYLSTDVAVEPIGDNIYTVIVRTPHHKETRQDIDVYRKQYPIEIELDKEVSANSTESTMAISGRTEPGATIVVDMDYIEESYQLDMTTGRFSFIVKFNKLRENTVSFHASMEGREDANVTFKINYKPTLAAYSAKAWKMDYEQLRLYYQTWTERIFLCKGVFVDSFEEEGSQFLVMNINPNGEPQYCVLENFSKTTPTFGPLYEAYADVTGHHYYGDSYQPMLAAMYIDLAA